MHEDTLDSLGLLEYRPTTRRRVTYEEFELHPCGNGDIEEVNASDGPDKADHSHVLHVVSGIPSDYTCPAWLYRESACKYTVRVALSPAVIEAASPATDDGDSILVADGGEVSATAGSCPFGDSVCGGISGLFFGELSCWDCYRLAPPQARDIHQAWIERRMANRQRPQLAGQAA